MRRVKTITTKANDLKVAIKIVIDNDRALAQWEQAALIDHLADEAMKTLAGARYLGASLSKITVK